MPVCRAPRPLCGLPALDDKVSAWALARCLGIHYKTLREHWPGFVRLRFGKFGGFDGRVVTLREALELHLYSSRTACRVLGIRSPRLRYAIRRGYVRAERGQTYGGDGHFRLTVAEVLAIRKSIRKDGRVRGTGVGGLP